MAPRSRKSHKKSAKNFPAKKREPSRRREAAAGVTEACEEVEDTTSILQSLGLDPARYVLVGHGQWNLLSCYLRCLHQERRWFPLTRDNTYALADCDGRGQLKQRSYQLVRPKVFESVSGERHVLYLCSCDNAREQNGRLSAMDNVVTGEDLRAFAVREEGLYCLHARAADQIITPPLITEELEEEEGEDEDEEEEEEDVYEGAVDQLQLDPFLAAVHDGDTYGIVKRLVDGKLCCVMCTEKQTSCTHVNMYVCWCTYRGVKPDLMFTDSGQHIDMTNYKSKIFSCDHCGLEPKTIIFDHDDTAFGFRKDLLQHMHTHQPSPEVTEYESDKCRKGLNELPSPGVLSLFCPHGVCYGFELIRSCDLPQHEFELIRTRFRKAPKVIVSANSCQLHEYALDRDPHFVKNTLFLIGRSDFKGHICSLGYSLNMYTAALDVKSLNTRVNKIAKSRLLKVQPHLAYMTPSDFMLHASKSLAIRNMNVRGRY
ncbi:uncharacterized protein [Branchiostoma lanceolatum]|uniref:uncharacterized protein n=1 Tax=Branchiostoma lanceolatum TaxID=7740 RepID=UPI003456DC4D